MLSNSPITYVCRTYIDMLHRFSGEARLFIKVVKLKVILGLQFYVTIFTFHFKVTKHVNIIWPLGIGKYRIKEFILLYLLVLKICIYVGLIGWLIRMLINNKFT